MTDSRNPCVEAYLSVLDRELRRRFVVDPAIREEVRGHLTDAIAHGESAEQAIDRFGTPVHVAELFAVDRTRWLYRALCFAAVACGMGIAYVDSRPGWDDAGISAGALLIAAGILGLAAPRRPWLWAVCIGIWIPANAIARTPSLSSLAMLIVLLFPIAGAWMGRAVRRAMLPAA
jgi:hypothetical protein